jgi:hypothetical protein
VIGYGVCVGDWGKLAAYVTPRVPGPLMAVSGHSSICRAYNQILDYYRGWDLDALVLLHDDLEITDPAFEDKLRAAMASDVAVVGVCGGPSDASLAWWNTPGCVGHQATDSGLIDFGPRAGDVAMVEGSLMALSPWAVAGLRFDEDYTGFHGYPDICVAARAAGRRVTVADIDTHHHTTVGFKSAEVQRSFTVTDWMYQHKRERVAA